MVAAPVVAIVIFQELFALFVASVFRSLLEEEDAYIYPLPALKANVPSVVPASTVNTCTSESNVIVLPLFVIAA